jgi:hypothetical protein
MKLSDVYEYDPWTALQHVLTEAKNRGALQGALLWAGFMGVDGRTRYGRYRYVQAKDLIGRTYVIEFLDYMVGIRWLDALHDPSNGGKTVALDDL